MVHSNCSTTNTRRINSTLRIVKDIKKVNNAKDKLKKYMSYMKFRD